MKKHIRKKWNFIKELMKKNFSDFNLYAYSIYNFIFLYINLYIHYLKIFELSYLSTNNSFKAAMIKIIN
jgi:hypothetical protein